MKIEDLFNQTNIIDLSFFNFRNAVTAAYYANEDFQILKVNDNFKTFFPVLGNVSHAYFPDVLSQLGVSGEQIELWEKSICKDGRVLIPKIEIRIDGKPRIFSLLSTRTSDPSFPYLNGIQGQFIDRTDEWTLRREREALLEEKIRDREIIEEKSRQLEELATRLAKYLSPQIYESIFSGRHDPSEAIKRRNLTIFFSDLERFTDLSDTLEPERLASIINSYLSEMSSIALECGGTIDKFVGDAILVFFGDPETEGEEADALKAIEMSIRMKQRVAELQSYWKKLGAVNGLHLRMGVTTGFCTVGNFGSEQMMEYTVLGSPVNLASRLQSAAPRDSLLVSEDTYNLIHEHVDCEFFDDLTPKGFVRPIKVYKVLDFHSEEHRARRRRLSHTGDHIEVNVIDSSNIRAAIEELRRIQTEFEAQYAETEEDAATEA